MTKVRWLVVVLVLILAALATSGVFLYSDGVQLPATARGRMVPVVVSDADIPAKTHLNRLIKDDQFRIIQIPKRARIDGAITSIDQLRNSHNVVAILAGEQIPAAKIKGV